MDGSTAGERFRVAIVGSGFAGLGMAIRLKQAGIHDFVVLERGREVGGTWRDNSYPGCQCDVPSHLYSFSFAPNPDWTRTFSNQPEIWAYLKRCAEDYGITPHIRFGHDVGSARWDTHAGEWRLETSEGTIAADVFVSGMGALSEPSIPAIPGLDGFEGAAFHSAAWDHDHDLRGKRVAVIGTGASTIQIVPKIQPYVAGLKVFQRTPPWVLPHPDRPTTDLERRVYRALPPAQLAMRAAIYWARETFVLGFMHPRIIENTAERLGRAHLRRQVEDPELRRKLTPSYRMGCKRILISNDYYPALTQPGVELVTDAIAEVSGSSIVTRDGSAHEVDTIILGTGFHVTDLPAAEKIYGRDGRSLTDVWAGRLEAHAGTTVAGFPNLFWLLGPNTGLGHNSVVFMIEAQIAYVMDALRTMEARGIHAVEPRKDAQTRYNEELQRRMEGTVWTSGDCRSWYLDASGRNRTLWPGATWRFRQRTRRFDIANYETHARVGAGNEAVASA